MIKMRWFVTGLMAAVMMLGGMSARAAETQIRMDGSTTVGPIAKALAEYYMDQNEGVSIVVGESGSGNGVRSLINKSAEIANMSRFMRASEFKACVEQEILPVAHVVALDGLAIIVHSSNPVSDLTLEQVRKIYKGEITNWNEVGGPDRRIVRVSRDTNSGTYETFSEVVMQKERIAAGTQYVNSNGQARDTVVNTPAAIAFVGLGFTERVKALKINGVEASNETVVSGDYPIARALYMFTDGYPELGSHVHRLLTLHLTQTGQRIIEAIGFVPVTRY